MKVGKKKSQEQKNESVKMMKKRYKKYENLKISKGINIYANNLGFFCRFAKDNRI